MWKMWSYNGVHVVGHMSGCRGVSRYVVEYICLCVQVCIFVYRIEYVSVCVSVYGLGLCEFMYIGRGV